VLLLLLLLRDLHEVIGRLTDSMEAPQNLSQASHSFTLSEN
jgi:hypothetical protein